MKGLKDLKIGEWMPVPEGGFTIKTGDEEY